MTPCCKDLPRPSQDRMIAWRRGNEESQEEGSFEGQTGKVSSRIGQKQWESRVLRRESYLVVSLARVAIISTIHSPLTLDCRGNPHSREGIGVTEVNRYSVKSRKASASDENQVSSATSLSKTPKSSLASQPTVAVVPQNSTSEDDDPQSVEYQNLENWRPFPNAAIPSTASKVMPVYEFNGCHQNQLSTSTIDSCSQR